jgi:uncharacterized protein
VAKYEHRLQEVFNFDRRETAVLCVLLLRAAQTPGELRGRTERMYRFEALDEVLATLERLGQRQPPLVAMLPRQPGTKESRYMHLLSGAGITKSVFLAAQEPRDISNENTRLANLETEVAELKKDIFEIRQQLMEFRKQFE